MELTTAPGSGAEAHQTRSQTTQSPRSGPPEWQSFLSTETGSGHGSASTPSSGHKCRICHRTYERADHLNRHLKSHENARPYQCSQCQKSFNRVDLLNRHVATHERPTHGGKPIIRRTDRAGQACVACAAAKARCGDEKPCRRCQTKGIACETPNSSQIPNPQYTKANLPSAEDSANSSTYVQGVGQILSTGSQTGQFEPPFAFSPSTNLYSQEPKLSNSSVNGFPEPVNAHEQLVDTYGTGTIPVDHAAYDLDFMTEEMLNLTNTADFNNQNLDFGFLDFNFDEVHLDILNYPKDGASTERTNGTQPQRKMSRSLPRDASRAHAAFARSPWLWTPAQKDRILNDQDNLAVDEENISTTLTPGSTISLPGYQSYESPSIDARLRDRMFYLVCNMNKFTQRVPDFPSLDILNHVIKAFFVKQSYQVDNWIHVPTLSAAESHPEFLLGLVTAGSTVISVPAIWKMGLVLQDVVRVTLGDLWEKKNSSTRALQPLQAFMLCLDTGLWCGFQRQMEIAESFAQPIITMMRRGGILGSPLDTHALVPKEADDGHVLEVKWRKWCQRESFKRLVIHLFLHDTRASVALQKGPLISFTELSFSLPASRALFLASSAAEWKAKYLEHRTPLWRAPPRLLDALHDITILDDLQDECDVALCYTALLHGFWGQIWAYLEGCKFHLAGHKPDSAHQLWLTTQHRELYRDIEAFKLSLARGAKNSPDLLLTVELFLMILYVSPEELQRFAGKGGEEAAVQVIPSLEQWASTGHARKAVWHAGQVFRAAALMPPAGLRDFLAIAVYFASLTIWTYSNLCPSSSRNGSERPKSRLAQLQDTTSVAIVDGPETRETRAFLSGHLDSAALTVVKSLEPIIEGFDGSNATTIRLADTNAALKIARDLYRSNFPVMDGPLPPLVENMGNLMRDLSSLPDSRFSRCASPADR
ncbi:hypothetical protein BKA64DRAFT_348221 [Cadophora sp. MPI-SDFR-AT-0126]|nr:hypothetical protein BKA64DRAFT_348221 [Leotiomycetes sp. MPI-SDFR-AT-0126]